jgi:cytochrome c
VFAVSVSRWPGLAMVVGAAALVACGMNLGDGAVSVPGGDPERGAELISSFGCGSCHTIPGIEGAEAVVGPPLTDMGRREYIVGNLPNEPNNMIRWLVDPQAVEPGTAMPNLGLSEREARHMAAYLYTLR